MSKDSLNVVYNDIINIKGRHLRYIMLNYCFTNPSTCTHKTIYILAYKNRDDVIQIIKLNYKQLQYTSLV